MDKQAYILESDGFFKEVDFYFAETLLRPYEKTSEANALFLAFLLAAAREGHLCVSIENGSVYPDIGYHEQLLTGCQSLPPDLFNGYLIKQDKRIYLQKNWQCESRFLTNWLRLKNNIPGIMIPHTILEKRLKEESLHEKQKDAIRKAAQYSLSLICGGPGTGKTFTASRLISLFLDCLEEGDIAVAAPTGKAAANLRVALQPVAEKKNQSCRIQTLHSLLGIGKRMRTEVLPADLIVVDESSMVDAHVMSFLFASVKEGGRLVLIGDPFQLPPVEAGHFFADLAFREEAIKTELSQCLRTEDKGLMAMAGAIQQGSVIPFSPLPPVSELVKTIVNDLGLNHAGTAPQETCRYLSPLRQGPYGVDSLNRLIYEQHKKGAGRKKIPILLTENHPQLQLYNGDTGILDEEEGMAYFPEKKIPKYSLPRYELAYVISVHKSQGSEYDHIRILLPEGAQHFGREMLYTACTRAKKTVSVFAAPGVMEEIVSKERPRLSGIGRVFD